MYLWRRTAETSWVEAHESLLQAHAHGQLVVVQRPGRKRLDLEIICRSRTDTFALIKKFGGRVAKLPRNWLHRFAAADSGPINIGKRLVISSVGRALLSQHRSQLIIPASLAFGTGAHATTAMSLRFLEKLTRRWKRDWSLVDLGTGSGILALAAKRFGAGCVTGIDNDPTAISVAKSNARLNKIGGVSFRLADVHKWKSPQETDVSTANLYSDLLIGILPKLNGSNWLILSGVLHSQEDELLRALQRNHFEIINTKRRGKWVAMLAKSKAHSASGGF